MPLFLRLFFTELQKSKIAAGKQMTDAHFIIMLPRAVLILGVCVIMILATIILVLTFLSNNSLSIASNPANIILYIIFGCFVVESIEISYERFMQIIKMKVDSEFLTGFE